MNMRDPETYLYLRILRNRISSALAVKIYNNNSSYCFLLIFYVQKNLLKNYFENINYATALSKTKC